jgi:PEGA domain-containing protein
MVAAMAMAASPAAAQEDRGRGHASEGQAVQRRSEARSEPTRSEAARRDEAAHADASGRVEAARVESRAAADVSQRAVSSRAHEGRAVPRPEVISPRVERPVVVAPRVARPIVVAPRVYAPRYYYGGYYGYRPGYRPYAFRPWTQLSFGLFVGYPVRYVYAYPYPVPVYGYGAPSAPVYITPNSPTYGSISLEVSPSDADVFVDGQYVGQVRDFDGIGAPLTLTPGRHRVELAAAGYEPLSFDVNVVPGQVVPYRGDMRRSW